MRRTIPRAIPSAIPRTIPRTSPGTTRSFLLVSEPFLGLPVADFPSLSPLSALGVEVCGWRVWVGRRVGAWWLALALCWLQWCVGLRPSRWGGG